MFDARRVESLFSIGIQAYNIFSAQLFLKFSFLDSLHQIVNSNTSSDRRRGWFENTAWYKDTSEQNQYLLKARTVLNARYSEVSRNCRRWIAA